MNYLKQKFPRATASKIEAGIFDGPQIRALYGDQAFNECLGPAHLEAWEAFQDIVHSFLGNYRSLDYVEKIDTLLQKFNVIGSNMTPKLHFLFSHLDIFPTNLGSESDEQGERFHQEMEEIERRYKGWWDEQMMADYVGSSFAKIHPKKKNAKVQVARHFN